MTRGFDLGFDSKAFLFKSSYLARIENSRPAYPDGYVLTVYRSGRCVNRFDFPSEKAALDYLSVFFPDFKEVENV